MNGSHFKLLWLVIPVLLSLGQAPACFGDPPSNAVSSEVSVWIDGLQSDRFAVREWATQRLADAGPEIIDQLAEQLNSLDVESMERGLSVLHDKALRESATSVHAENAIRQLAINGASASARRAEEVLNSILASRTERGEKILQRLGADFEITPLNPYSYGSTEMKTITFGDRWTGKVADLTYVSWLSGYPRIAIKAKGDKITDEWLFKFAEAQNLVGLSLSRTKVTDKGMSALSQMPLLRELRVYYCEISDASLEFIDSNQTAIRTFSVFGSQITKVGFNRFLESQPGIVGRYGVGGFLGIAGRADPDGQGCIVSAVTPNEAASKADIRPHDLITEYNGKRVKNFVPPEQLPQHYIPVIPQPEEGEEQEDLPALSQLIGQNAPGDRVKVTIQRGNERLVKEVELGEWP